MKNVNKNNLRILLTGVIIGGLIFGSIGVAAITLTADQIKYTPSNEKFTATNAKEALDEIYKIAEYEIPENTYFYEEGTEGDSATIIRYKKIGEKYFICDETGIVTDSTTAIDVSSKKLRPYTATTSGNLSAGSASFASNFFILGDGSDNTSYYTQGINKGITQSKPFIIPQILSRYGNISFDTKNYKKFRIEKIKCTSTQAGRLKVNNSTIYSYPNVNGDGYSQTVNLNYELDLTNIDTVTIYNEANYGWLSNQYITLYNISFE